LKFEIEGDQIMMNKIDELGKNLHTKLDAGVDQLKTIKAHLEAAPKEAEAAIQRKLDAAKATLATQKEAAATAKARLRELVEEKKEDTKDLVTEWKAKHDRKKLEKRAERAEKYAETLVDVTLYSALESEKAILDAIAARKDADDANQSEI
jgi:glutamate synthase domain-containing protein 1